MGIKEIFAINRLIERFGKDVNDKWDYGFKIFNDTDYEMNIKYRANSKVMNSLFLQSSKVMGRLHPKFSKLRGSNPDMIQKMDVPKEMLARVHTAIYKNIKMVSTEVKKDGIILLRSKVDSCVFEKEKEEDKEVLYIKINVVGQYAKA